MDWWSFLWGLIKYVTWWILILHKNFGKHLVIVYVNLLLQAAPYVTRFVKTQCNNAFFGNPGFWTSEFHIPKALFCSNINAVLQIVKLDSKRSNTLAIYTHSIKWLVLYVFNYTIMSYEYCNIWSWDNNHSTQLRNMQWWFK